MRIAYVSADPGVPVFGRKGASVHVQEMSRALLRAGHALTLLAVSFKGEAPAGLERAETVALPAPGRDLEPAERERQALEGNAATAAALREAGPFDMVYERYSLWSYAGMEFASERGIPGILEVNAPLIEEQERYRTLVDRQSAEAVLARATSAASAIVAVSEGVAGWLRAAGVEPGKILVIPNGVDTGRFRPDALPTLAAPAGAVVVGFTGTLKPWHGLATLTRAFQLAAGQAPELRLLVVGDGPQRESMEAALAPLAAEGRVTFTGAVAPGAVPGLLASMDIAVAPYEQIEDFYFSPLKLFEYMAAGRAIVASRIGQIPEILSGGATGLLVTPGDADELAGTILALSRSPQLRSALGAAARRIAVEHHTWDAIAARVADLAGASVREAA